MTIILTILCLVLYILGAIIVCGITGWNPNIVSDLGKIIFWPITIFIEK